MNSLTLTPEQETFLANIEDPVERAEKLISFLNQPNETYEENEEMMSEIKTLHMNEEYTDLYWRLCDTCEEKGWPLLELLTSGELTEWIEKYSEP